MAVNRNVPHLPVDGPGVPRAGREADALERGRRRWSSCWSAAFSRCGVTLTRWQAVHLLPPDWFYQVLTAHGLNMLVFWIIFFEIAVLYFAASHAAALPPGDAGHGLGRLLADDDRRADEQLLGVPRRLERDVHLLRADGRAPDLLPRPDPVRGGRADRLLRVLRHAGGGEERADLQRLGAAGHLRRGDRGDHRGVHHRLGRDHPHPDLPLVARA